MKILCRILLAAVLPATISSADEPATLVIGVHENLVPKEQLNRAPKTLEQLVKLIGDRVRVPAKVRIIPGGTRETLDHTAAALRAGQIQLVAVTGLEYGWLRS